MNRSRLCLFSLALALCAPLMAADKKKSAQSGMPTPEQMQKWGAPSAGHKVLDPLVGTFLFTSTLVMDPKAPPMVSTGTVTTGWALGGRFLKSDVTSFLMGRPFAGVEYLGYNNITGEYESVWMDNMSSAQMKSAGTYDAATKTIRQTGTMSCPMTGEKARPYRSELKIDGPGHYSSVTYDKDADGNEYKSMVLDFTRAK